MDAVIERSEITRESTIKAIKRALEKRSGKPWSVTGGRGTAWGWLTIDAPPERAAGLTPTKIAQAYWD